MTSTNTLSHISSNLSNLSEMEALDVLCLEMFNTELPRDLLWLICEQFASQKCDWNESDHRLCYVPQQDPSLLDLHLRDMSGSEQWYRSFMLGKHLRYGFGAHVFRPGDHYRIELSLYHNGGIWKSQTDEFSIGFASEHAPQSALENLSEQQKWPSEAATLVDTHSIKSVVITLDFSKRTLASKDGKGLITFKAGERTKEAYFQPKPVRLYFGCRRAMQGVRIESVVKMRQK